MKHIYILVILLCSYVCSNYAMGILDAARDAVGGAVQATEDTLDVVRDPGTLVEGAANVTNDALETTGNVVEDVLHPVSGRRRVSYEDMNEQEVPFIPEQNNVYMPPQPQEME